MYPCKRSVKSAKDVYLQRVFEVLIIVANTDISVECVTTMANQRRLRTVLEMQGGNAGIVILNDFNSLRRTTVCGLHAITLLGIDVLWVVSRVWAGGEVLVAVCDQRGEGVNGMGRLNHWHLI